MKSCIIYFNDQHLQMSLSILKELKCPCRVEPCTFAPDCNNEGAVYWLGWYPEGVREGGLHCNWFITLQNPNIKRKIFICCPCTFSIEVEGKSCQKYWLNSSYVIMFFYIFFFLRPLCFHMHWDKEEFDTGHSYRLNG